jgi:putative hydrolase of the HAD superfamily
MVKAIIFDCFGVIVGKGFVSTYRLAGGDPQKDSDFIEATLRRANLGQITESKFRSLMSDQIGISTDQWDATIKNTERVDTDLIDYIEDLHRTYKTAILSNANRGVINRVIGTYLNNGIFDEVIVSADVGMAKPDPQIYKLVTDSLHVDADECIYIDDRKSFVNIASGLGMQSVLYVDFADFKSRLTSLLAGHEAT